MCYPLTTLQLDNHEIKPGKCLKINISVPNLRLFVGNIPKSKGKEEILEEFGKLTGKFFLLSFQNNKKIQFFQNIVLTKNGTLITYIRLMKMEFFLFFFCLRVCCSSLCIYASEKYMLLMFV